MYQLLKRIFGRDRDSMIQTACSAYKATLCEKDCAFTPAYRVFASKENQKRVQDDLIRNRLVGVAVIRIRAKMLYNTH